MHTHLLYGVDDGSRSEEETLSLVRMDMEQGVSTIIATPHYDPEDAGQKEALLERFQSVKKLLQANGINIPLYLGCEVLYFGSIVEHLRAGKILTLADSDYVLVEFYPGESWQTICRAVRKIAQGGYRPVLAHIERYEALRSHDVSELTEEGAYLQLNAGSIGGGLFDKTASFCRKMLKEGLIDFLGSDMHRADTRPPKWERAAAWIRKNLSAEEAEAVLHKNALMMIENKELH